MTFTLTDIAAITGAESHGEHNRIIDHLVTDTRRVNWPENALFIALKGPNHDGHHFIDEAWQKGIRNFMTDRLPEDQNYLKEGRFLVVENTLLALQKLAAHHRRQLRSRIVGITGSNGKTTVKEWLTQLLQREHTTGKSPGSYNSQLGVALSVMGIQQNHTWGLLEAGISQPGEMARLADMICPELGLFTNLGDAHQQHFDSLEQKIQEKFILFSKAKKVYAGTDQPWVAQAMAQLPETVERITWSSEPGADLQVLSIHPDARQTTIKLRIEGKEETYMLPFTDTASIHNLILIILFLTDQGMEPTDIQKGITELEPVSMRLEQKTGIQGCTLINDFYNSDLASLTNAVDLLFQQTSQTRKSIILSDILQSGEPEEALYQRIADFLNKKELHRVFLIGPVISQHKQLFKHTVTAYPDTDSFLAVLDTIQLQNEAILLKGARRFAFERISQKLEQQVHLTQLEINLQAVRENLNFFRTQLRATTRLMVMVKAFAYGSGVIELARFLAHERVDYLGVAFIDEGIALRQAGITLPILVLNPNYQQTDLMVRYQLEPEVFDLEGWQELKSHLARAGVQHYPAHIKIDTGMHRLGFSEIQLEPLLRSIPAQEQIRIKSIFSHLGAAEDPAGDDRTREQIDRFERDSRLIQQEIGYPVMLHLANSAAVIRHPQSEYDMVRLGIGLYGYGYDPGHNLRSVMTLRSAISQVHDLPAGEFVGYGLNTQLKEPTRLAVVPLGYADGLDRRLGEGRFHLYWNNRPVPIIGQICMDMCMIDVTGTTARKGDEIIVFSPDHPASQMASILNTTPYEILTSIPQRIKRVYRLES